MKTFLNGITKENAILVLMMGMCPALAITTTLENSYIFGICFTFILLCSSILVNMLKKVLKGSIQTPMYILVIGIFVTIVEVFLKDYFPDLYQVFGIYLSLIVVNCVILGRMLQVAAKSSLKVSVLDALGVGTGYTFVLALIGMIREVLGTNTITFMDSISSLTGYRSMYYVYPKNILLPIDFLLTPAGAFLVLGLLLGIVNVIRERRK